MAILKREPKSWEPNDLWDVGRKAGAPYLRAVPLLILEEWVRGGRKQEASHIKTETLVRRLEGSKVRSDFDQHVKAQISGALNKIQIGRNLTNPPLIFRDVAGTFRINLPYYEDLLQKHRKRYYEEYPDDYRRLFPGEEPEWEQGSIRPQRDRIHTALDTALDVYEKQFQEQEKQLQEQISDLKREISELQPKIPSSTTTPFVNPDRIDELRALHPSKFSLERLIKLCEELNECFARGNYYAVGALGRTILDHVPPALGLRTFAQVVTDYGKGLPTSQDVREFQNFRNTMTRLQDSLRNIANEFVHTPMRGVETLPYEQSVLFQPELDRLLQEVIRCLKADEKTKP